MDGCLHEPGLVTRDAHYGAYQWASLKLRQYAPAPNEPQPGGKEKSADDD